jgi:phage recombination protein Bet
MSNIVQIQANEYSDAQITLIKNTLLNGSFSDNELSLFIHQAKRTGLDPFTRQIYATKVGGKMAVQATIDGLRLIAERSGKYQGQTKTEWCGKDGKWVDVWLSKDCPAAARIGVFKEGFKEPTYAIAVFEEYAQVINGKLGFMWAKMPALMIGKVAEALALRKAFPNDLSGIYSTEEMQQADQPYAEPTEPKGVQPTRAQENVFKDKAPADYVVTFGKFKGMPLKDIRVEEMQSYIDYLEKGAKDSAKLLTGGPLAFVSNAKQYLEEIAETQPLDHEPKLDDSQDIPF